MPLLLCNFAFIIFHLFPHRHLSIKKKSIRFLNLFMEPRKAVAAILLGQHLLTDTSRHISRLSPLVNSNLLQLQGSGFVLHTLLWILIMDLRRRNYRYTTTQLPLLKSNLSCPDSLHVGEKALRIGQNMFSPLMVATLIPGG